MLQYEVGRYFCKSWFLFRLHLNLPCASYGPQNPTASVASPAAHPWGNDLLSTNPATLAHPSDFPAPPQPSFGPAADLSPHQRHMLQTDTGHEVHRDLASGTRRPRPCPVSLLLSDLIQTPTNFSITLITLFSSA